MILLPSGGKKSGLFFGVSGYAARLGTDVGRRLPVGGAWGGLSGEGDMGGSAA